MCNWLTWRYVCRKTHYFPPPQCSITNQFGSKPSSGGRLREELKPEPRAPGVRNENEWKWEADRKKLQCGGDETDGVSLKTVFNFWWNGSCWRKNMLMERFRFWSIDVAVIRKEFLCSNQYKCACSHSQPALATCARRWRQAAEEKNLIREIVERKQKEGRA